MDAGSANVPRSRSLRTGEHHGSIFFTSFAECAALETQASDMNMSPPDPSTDVAQESVRAPGLPDLGKWMLDHTGSAAHWFGEIYNGKKLREPINVVILDCPFRKFHPAVLAGRARIVA